MRLPFPEFLEVPGLVFMKQTEGIYFGEFTPHTDAGLIFLSPDQWDYTYGEMLDLPRCEKEYLVEYPAAHESIPYHGEIPR